VEDAGASGGARRYVRVPSPSKADWWTWRSSSAWKKPLATAAGLGFKVNVAAEACATRALTFGQVTVSAAQVQAAFLTALKSYGQVLSVEETITHLAAEQIQSLRS